MVRGEKWGVALQTPTHAGGQTLREHPTGAYTPVPRHTHGYNLCNVYPTATPPSCASDGQTQRELHLFAQTPHPPDVCTQTHQHSQRGSKLTATPETKPGHCREVQEGGGRGREHPLIYSTTPWARRSSWGKGGSKTALGRVVWWAGGLR